ncbi:reverse transcriptase domain-containing protein [Tanacetum coccineum]
MAKTKNTVDSGIAPGEHGVPLDDTVRTMVAQLLESTIRGLRDAIVVTENPADNFELKHDHFYDEVPERPETPRSNSTWDDIVSKFINKFFPPSKTTNLRNEITRFQQRFDETFYEAWDRFNDLLGLSHIMEFSVVTSTRYFYNALNSNDQDSLNSAAGVSSSSSTLGISPNVVELKDMVKALLLDKKYQAPTPVKAVEESCVTCGGTHSYRNCPATNGNVYHDNIQDYVSQATAANYNQRNTDYRAPIANQIRPPGFPPVRNQGNNQNRYNQNRGYTYNQGQIYRPPINQPPVHQAPPYQAPAPQIQDMLSKFVNANTASSSGTGSLPSNTVTNPKEDLKGITTRSGVAYQGPTIPTTSSSSQVVERETKVTKDTVLPTNNRSTKDVQPPVVQD